MAIIYRATISPTKLELVEQWLGLADARQVGSYRFDDPDGEVGIEALLVEAGGEVRQAALSYRSAPLAGADDHLITTMEHSVLGKRWIHDAQGDPVALAAFARALTGEQEQAPLEIWEGDARVEVLEPTVALEPIAATDAAPLAGAIRVPGATTALLARWEGGEGIVALGG
ncbi:maltokinase N-terminal cap-like domain-containing protein [Nocardioides sp. AE5]|uniref:maltokinase N-terminal cap-like domain-containing protein n=1 Tax=Nocardioides sp. AE5 TaxID=2962573 RepID=UPI002882BA60|nr:hypothetical protein [Nocardioides sp. AE5]MDT0200429.1 hypothetical protein [Nocardioides sp. AE5]